MKIPFVDLRRMHSRLRPELDAAVAAVVEKGDFVLGESVAEFEKEFARFIGAAHAVGVGSGTEALHLALRAAGIGPGDGVIVPVNTFIATALAVVYCGASPVFVDCDERTYTLDLSRAEDALARSNGKITAVIPVHLYGQACDMQGLLSLAQKHRLAVIEDACQAHGADVRVDGAWKKAGACGHLSCFSFYPGKNLGGFGDGGLIATDSDEYRDRLKMLRDLGQKEKYRHLIAGYNSRLDTLQAAVLRVKLPYLAEWNESRRQAAAWYHRYLKDTSCVLPGEEPYARHIWHLFVVRVQRRDEMKRFLLDNGISCGIHYPYPLHLTPAFSHLGHRAGDFPVAEKICAEALSLPIFPYLEEREVAHIAGLLRTFAAR